MARAPYIHEIQDIKVAVDVVAIAYQEGELYTLLIQREYPPFAGQWAFPGGFVRIEEEVEAAAVRIVRDETGVQAVEHIQEIGVFSKVNRDPRRRVISNAFLTLMNDTAPVAGQVTEYMATSDARWWKLTDVPNELAFDHEDIMTRAKKVLGEQLTRSNIGRWLLPREFTKEKFNRLYQKVTDRAALSDAQFELLISQGIIEATKFKGKYQFAY